MGEECAVATLIFLARAPEGGYSRPPPYEFPLKEKRIKKKKKEMKRQKKEEGGGKKKRDSSHSGNYSCMGFALHAGSDRILRLKKEEGKNEKKKKKKSSRTAALQNQFGSKLGEGLESSTDQCTKSRPMQAQL